MSCFLRTPPSLPRGGWVRGGNLGSPRVSGGWVRGGNLGSPRVSGGWVRGGNLGSPRVVQAVVDDLGPGFHCQVVDPHLVQGQQLALQLVGLPYRDLRAVAVDGEDDAGGRF